MTVLALGGTSAWLSIRDAQKVAAADEDALLTPPGIAPSCNVISVHDGDTMKLDCGWDEAKPQIITVRLYCIDAPELAQEPWGSIAREHLLSIAGQVVAIEPIERDRLGRLVAKLKSNGADISLQMVADGYAPLYPKYCHEERFQQAQLSVQDQHRGIWSQDGWHRTPWLWRASHKRSGP